MRSRRWRRWSDLSQVERVDVYTRQSLYLLLWGVCGFVLFSALDDVGGVRAAVAVGGGLVVTVLGTAVMSSVFAQHPVVHPLPWRRLVPFLLVCVVYLGAMGVTSADTLRGAAVTVTVSNLGLSLGGVRDNRISAALPVASGLLFGLTTATPLNVLVGAGVGAAFVFTARASLWLFGIVTELDAARQAQARLAVAEERLRFSRDVHDVLGRRLSAIAVQSELAATLAERGDDRAAARMLQVRGVAHEALREAHELARGYRPTDLGTELAGARSLLRSAGIDVRLDVGTVPRAWHEAAGWVVRESVTNVLRHSAASLVTISYSDGELRVVNDGVRSGRSADGLGLRGLRERLEPLGAALVVEPHDDQWAVVARLPGTGPLSAAAAAEVGP